MSPLSAGGFGRQLTASNARASAAGTTNGMRREIVFLMRTVRSPDSSGQTKQPLPLTLHYRGLHRLYHRVRARGNRVNLVICNGFFVVVSARCVVPSPVESLLCCWRSRFFSPSSLLSNKKPGHAERNPFGRRRLPRRRSSRHQHSRQRPVRNPQYVLL